MMNRTIASRPKALTGLLLAALAALAAAIGLAAIVMRAWAAFRLSSESPLRIMNMGVVNAPTPEFRADLPGTTLTYSSIDVVINEAPAHLRWLSFWNDTAQIAPIIVAAALIVWLSAATLRGRPFLRTTALALILGGASLAALQTVSDVLRGQVQNAVINHFGPDAVGGSDQSGVHAGFSSGYSYDFTLIGVGIVLVVLGIAFTLGARLQREADRLV